MVRLFAIVFTLTACIAVGFAPLRPFLEKNRRSHGPMLSDRVVDLAQALKMRRDPSTLIVDVRSLEEYEKGHIPGAFSLPLAVMRKSGDPDARVRLAKRIILYCGGVGCGDAFQAYDLIKTYPTLEPYVYGAGWTEWVSAGLPSENGTASHG